MKCPNCGANLTIDDEVCSFCGNASPYAAKHRREMRRFTSDFNKTKSSVLNKSQTQGKWAVKITLIAILVALNCMIWFMVANFYEVESFIKTRKVDSQYLIHKSRLEQYEEERDFMGFQAYYSENDLYYSDKLREFDNIHSVCNSLSSMYMDVMSLVTEEETDYYPAEQRIENISHSMEYIYQYSVKDKYDDESKFTPQHQECMNDMVELAEGLIQVYLNVSDEDMEQFPELSAARRQIIMEEGFIKNE